MIAPYIIEELERDRRRSDWQPQPLYIEAPRPYGQRADRDREGERETERVIIIDYSGNDS